MRGPILREQFFWMAQQENVPGGIRGTKERGNHHAERETAQEQL